MEERVDKIVKSLENKIVNSVCEMIRIKSVPGKPVENGPFGQGIKDALSASLTLGKNMGFEIKNVDGYAGHIQYGNSGKLYGVLGHLDVVPEGIGWNRDPYGGIIEENRIWGRGSVDDKGPVVAVLYALKAIQLSGLPIRNRVRIILGTNEETGRRGIKYYLEREEQPVFSVTPDSKFPMVFAEKGIVNYKLTEEAAKSDSGLVVERIDGGEAPNMVPSITKVHLKGNLNEVMKKLDTFSSKNGATLKSERTGNELIISFEGQSAHGSNPSGGINSIAVALDFISGLTISNKKLKIFIDELNEKIGYETDGKSLNIACMDKVSGNLTVNLGTLKYDGKTVEALLNIRYPIFFTRESIFNQLRESLKFNVETLYNQPPLYISPDCSEIKLLRSIYEEVTGEDSTPIAIGGGTYARSIKNCIAFGPVTLDKAGVVHKPNEYIVIDDLIKLARIYARLFYELLK